MQHFERHFSKRFESLLARFPIVCLLGPRQCGKTTFVKDALPHWRYVDLEKPSDLVRISEDPEASLEQWKTRIIFDEAQRLPSLFPVLRSFIDEHGKKAGQIVLLGSASFELMDNISESLAGRVGFLDMTPFHFEEIPDGKKLWFRGGFPDAYRAKSHEQWQDWCDAYTRTFIERDLKGLGVDISSVQMRRFCSMLSHVHGGIWNASEVGGSIGFSYHTANRYLDILEQTFLARRLQPYFANVGKRLIKSPKVYFRDSGLMHYFQGIRTPEELQNHPKRGSSWEGFVIEQVISSLALQSPGCESFFYSTSTKKEIDLVIKKAGLLLPIEIKLHSSPKADDVAGLFSGMKDLGSKRGCVIRPQGESYSLGQGVTVYSLEKFLTDVVKDI